MEQEEFNPDLTIYRETIANMLSNPQFRDSYMFYGFMIAQVTPIAKDFQAAAGVTFVRDHYVLYINPTLFDKFSLVQRLGVLKHEMQHIMNGHLSRVHDRDFMKFNYATDCAINQFIDRDHLPDGVIYPDNLPSKLSEVPKMLSAEQYYDIIDDEQLPKDDPNGSGGAGLDDHSVWEEATGDPELQADITKNMLESSMESTQKNRGNLPGNISDALELHSRKSEVNWKQLLRRLVSNKKANSRATLMRSSRRFPKREDIKGKTRDRTFTLAVIGDESGSVSSEELTEAINEIQHICKMTNTPLWYVPVDTVAHKPHQITKNQRTFNRSACGGTELNPAITMLNDHKIEHSAIVVITDGYLCSSDVEIFHEIPKKVFWLITSQGCIMPEMQVGRHVAVKLPAKKEE